MLINAAETMNLLHEYVFMNAVSDLCDRELRNVLSSAQSRRVLLTRVSVRGIPHLDGMLTVAPATTLTISTTLNVDHSLPLL